MSQKLDDNLKWRVVDERKLGVKIDQGDLVMTGLEKGTTEVHLFDE